MPAGGPGRAAAVTPVRRLAYAAAVALPLALAGCPQTIRVILDGDGDGGFPDAAVLPADCSGSGFGSMFCTRSGLIDRFVAGQWVLFNCSILGATDVEVGAQGSPIAGEWRADPIDGNGNVKIEWRFAASGTPLGMADRDVSVCVYARKRGEATGSGELEKVPIAGQTWVANSSDNSVVVLASDGTQVGRVGLGATFRPYSMGRLADGRVLVGASSAAPGEAMVKIIDLGGGIVGALDSARGQAPFDGPAVVGAVQASSSSPIFVALASSATELVRYDILTARPVPLSAASTATPTGIVVYPGDGRIFLSGPRKGLVVYSGGSFTDLLLTSPFDDSLGASTAIGSARRSYPFLIGFEDQSYGVVALYNESLQSFASNTSHFHSESGKQDRLPAPPLALAELTPDAYLATWSGGSSIQVLDRSLDEIVGLKFGAGAVDSPRGMVHLR